jgi:hypothetical protein
MSNRTLDSQLLTAKSVAARLIALLAHPAVLIVVVALSAWLLDGFNIGPINDGWTFMGGESAAGPMIGSWAEERPFIPIPMFLGLTLMPHSFQGWQVIMLLVTCARGLLFYAIIRRFVPEHPLFCLACGLIAVFHPGDSSFFWAECVGPHFGIDLALAACLTAIIFLQTGSIWVLCATVLLQFLACFTYSSCLPLMLALPAGAWLLSRVQGPAQSVWRLLVLIAPILVLTGVYAVLVSHGNGRAGAVMSMNMGGVVEGYSHESGLFLQLTGAMLAYVRPSYLPFVLVPGLLAWYFTTRAVRDEPAPPPSWRAQLLIFVGLIVLAGVSYLPYAVSTVRFGIYRQLLVPGMFLYSDVLFLVFVVLPSGSLVRWLPARLRVPWVPARLRVRWLRVPHWQPLLVAVLAAVTVLVGLQKREIFISQYRVQEQLLAAIAQALPNPAPNTVILVHLPDRFQAAWLAGLYNRTIAFTGALRFMYDDYPTSPEQIRIRGGFTSFGQTPDFTFESRRLKTTHQWHPGYSAWALYKQLVLIGYDGNGTAMVLGRKWLQQFAPQTNLRPYDPVTQGPPRTSPTSACTMLEKDLRPSYCSR